MIRLRYDEIATSGPHMIQQMKDQLETVFIRDKVLKFARGEVYPDRPCMMIPLQYEVPITTDQWNSVMPMPIPCLEVWRTGAVKILSGIEPEYDQWSIR